MSIKSTVACIVFMLVILCSLRESVSAAQDEDSCHTATYNTCMEKSEGVTVAMVDCMEAERVIIQAKIEKLYKEAVSQQSEERNAELKSAVQDWKKYRTSMGGYLYNPDGGSSARINSVSWTLEETDRLCVLLKYSQQ